jgi:hypothetical protein
MVIETPEVVKRNGEENFTFQGQSLNIALQEFWSWTCSDLLNNAMRGILAEFLITKALDVDSEYRLEWDAFDVETRQGLKVEIKSSSYLQGWKQEQYSQITFGIQPTHGWNAKTNEYSSQKKRQSDIYVFCVLSEKDPQKVNPTNLEQWEFYILETRILDEKLGKQKTLRLSSLLGLNPIKTDYLHLGEEIKKIEEKILDV